MGQFAILVLLREPPSGILRDGFVADEPIEADTPVEAMRAFLISQDFAILRANQPALIIKLSAHRARYYDSGPPRGWVFNKSRHLYMTTDEIQEITWFHLLRDRERRQVVAEIIDSAAGDR